MKNLLSIISIFLLFGCMSPGYRIIDELDPYTNIHIIKQEENGGLPLSHSPGYHFNLQYFPNTGELRMEFIYDASDWLFIRENDESIVFIADGENVPLKTGKVYSDTYIGAEAMVKEWTYIDIDKDTIKKLANAQSLSCRIYGSKYYSDVTLLPAIQKNWKDFINKYLN